MIQIQTKQSTLPAPPLALLDGASLFLDFDGTLSPLAETPDAVDVDDALLTLLARLRDRLDGRLAIVSGRSVATLRELGFGAFLLSGTHGLEFARPGEAVTAPPRRLHCWTVRRCSSISMGHWRRWPRRPMLSTLMTRC